MRNTIATVVLALSFGLCNAPAQDTTFRPCRVTLVRHAETVANVTKIYIEENQRRFSPKGKEQVDVLTRVLRSRTFDVILCSPAYRCRQTLLPYLRASGAKAELWPEVEECCWQRDREKPVPVEVGAGEPVQLEPGERDFFLPPQELDALHLPQRTYREGIQHLEAAQRQFLDRYSGRGLHILVMSHQHSGGRLAELLLGEAPEGLRPLENAVLTELEEKAPGRFEMINFNTLPEPATAIPPAVPAEPVEAVP